MTGLVAAEPPAILSTPSERPVDALPLFQRAAQCLRLRTGAMSGRAGGGGRDPHYADRDGTE